MSYEDTQGLAPPQLGLYEQVYREQNSRFIGQCIRARLNQQDAEDVVHDVFERELRRTTYNPDYGVPIANWLYRHVASRRVDNYRANTRRARHEDAYFADFYETYSVDPSDVCEEQERVDELYEAVHQLPANYRHVILLELTDLTQAQIAAQLKLPLGTAKTRLREAKQMLRRIMLNPEQQAA